MSATETLKEEHKVIERLLNVLRVASERLERGHEVPAEIFEEALDFIRAFADRCHHGKEENVLFPALEARGISRVGGPIGVMLAEHDDGRNYVRALAEAVSRYRKGDKTAKREIAKNAMSYVNLLSQHIPKENNILYPIGDRVLPKSEQKQLIEKFEEIERERIGEGKHQEYIRLVSELEKKLQI